MKRRRQQDDDREALQLAARQHEATLKAAKQAVQERNRAGHNATTVMRELETRMATVIAEKQELASELTRALAERARANGDASAMRVALVASKEGKERATAALATEEIARRRDVEAAERQMQACAAAHAASLAAARADVKRAQRDHSDAASAAAAELERLRYRNRCVEEALTKAEEGLEQRGAALEEAKKRASQISTELCDEHDRVVRERGRVLGW